MSSPSNSRDSTSASSSSSPSFFTNNDHTNDPEITTNDSESTPTHDELFLQRLKQQYSSPALQSFRPEGWSIVMSLCSGTSTILSYVYRLPWYPSALACGLFAYTYTCFRDGSKPPSPSKGITDGVTPSNHDNDPFLSSSSSSTANSSTLPAKQFQQTLATNQYKKREEGYLSGIGTSALFASLQFAAMRKYYEEVRYAAYQKWLSSSSSNPTTTTTNTTATVKGSPPNYNGFPIPPSSVLPSLRSTVFNPLALNVLLLSSASAIYYSLMMRLDPGEM